MGEQGKGKTFIRYKITNALRYNYWNIVIARYIDILINTIILSAQIDDVFQYCEVQNIKHNCFVNKENVKYCQVPL